MTKEEIVEFQEKIAQTIIPVAVNMTEEQIKKVIDNVSKENPELPKGFAKMVFEQILIQKYNKSQL